ncbi:MAG: MtrB/PioB family outer membrane beta-barrel protein [Nitrospirota bacterium]|jgi:hypothetical protein
MTKRAIICIVGLCAAHLLVFCTPAVAQEEYIQPYKYPEIEPKLILEGGFGLVWSSGSPRAGKYWYLEDSPTFEAHLEDFPFPHRVYLEVDYLNDKDYFVDARYAYRDLVLSRWLNSTVYHNLDNITLLDLGGAGSPDVLRRDAGQRYHIRTGINRLFLRFKTPDYPFHVYLNGRIVNKNGSVQRRFLGGAGTFDNLVRTSQRRDIDWTTTDLTVGLNSHLGPIEADYSHREKRFDVDGQRLMTESYEASTERPAGVFPHSLTPDFKSSTDTLKVHTSYTGKITASFTVSSSDSDNRISGAQADYLAVAGDLRWMPLTKLTFFFKYRHRERDAEARSTLPVGYLGFPSYTAPVVSGVQIRPLISSRSDVYSATVRYRAIRNLDLRAGFKHRDTDRSTAVDWQVSPSTTQNSVFVSAATRLAKRLKLDGKYEYTHEDSPAYNTQPEDSHRGRVAITWSPLERLMAFLSYDLTRGESNDITIMDSLGVGHAVDRDIDNDKVMGSLTYLFGEKLSLTGTYAYMRNKVKQGEIFGETAPLTVDDVRYRNQAHTVSISSSYSPLERLRLGAGISHTRSKGDFSPDPAGVASLSRLEVWETIYSASADYEISGGWDVAASYEFTDFDDRVENPQNPTFSDGQAHLLFVSLSKEW